MYSVLPYFLSKMIAELPISAFFPSVFGVLLYQMTGLHPKRDRQVLCAPVTARGSPPLFSNFLRTG